MQKEYPEKQLDYITSHCSDIEDSRNTNLNIDLQRF